jgi:hypothetical protein
MEMNLHQVEDSARKVQTSKLQALGTQETRERKRSRLPEAEKEDRLWARPGYLGCWQQAQKCGGQIGIVVVPRDVCLEERAPRATFACHLREMLMQRRLEV